MGDLDNMMASALLKKQIEFLMNKEDLTDCSGDSRLIDMSKEYEDENEQPETINFDPPVEG